MESIPIYFMPGMAASPKIFEFISLSEPFECHLLSWIPPQKNEPLSDYAKRMAERVKQPNPILVGVSFGGVLVQEMAHNLNVRALVLVSSIKSHNELPRAMKMADRTNIHKLLPTQWIKSLDALALFAFGNGIKKRLELYQKYLSERDPEYLNWAIDTLVHWKQERLEIPFLHIHGSKDNVFPAKHLQSPVEFIDGGHAIILTQSQWFNANLALLLKDF